MSTLSPGQLFNNRYLLVKALGQGASAEVWMARDTRANNLLVALKIFSENSGMDTSGMQNFEKEFTSVYNMKHSNLLPPTGYDVADGRPFLIMQYCENGSCSSLATRMDEADLLKFLHDVAAGLEYLHDHNIIHQDIKPDNILIDDHCNYMVTDFGISVNSEGGVFNSNGVSEGTRAYMGPERFQGQTVNASDMWSLGATAVELLTGNPPYGDHGGLLQAEGEPLPQLPEYLQPEVRDMIMSTLSADPDKRIKANEMRQKIEQYWETGKWNRQSNKTTYAYIITAIACLLVCLFIFLWDYNRTKVYYYKDYAEFYGVPKGIGRLSSGDVKHRTESYRFEYTQRKLRRVALVNSHGNVISHSDTEHMNSRYTDAQYFYTDNGKIDYIIISDQNGTVQCKLDYDDNLATATFRYNDQYGTEMNLMANTNHLFKDNDTFNERSRISRFLLTYDDNGQVVQRRYAGLQNVPASDGDNIYGISYVYDDKGRIVEQSFIGADGEITSDRNGMATRRYEYDADNNWISVVYLNVEGEGSHDGNNSSRVEISYDKYGNRVAERYLTLDGEPSIRTDYNVAGFDYEIDSNGHRVAQICIGLDGKPAYSNQGFVKQRIDYDDNGFMAVSTFLDENDEPTISTQEDMSYSTMTLKSSPTGLPFEVAFFDENEMPLEQSNGVASLVMEYDERGNMTSQKYFDKDGNPAFNNGFNHERRMDYDEFNNLLKEAYYDASGNPTTGDGYIAAYELEYNRQGSITKVTFLSTDGKPLQGANMPAGYSREFDEVGNLRSTQYFNAAGNPVLNQYGYARSENTYDPKTNFLVKTVELDANGREIATTHYKYDTRGNQIETYVLVGGALKNGTVVQHTEFDSNNRMTSEWATDLSGRKINLPGTAFAQARYEYDPMGNVIVMTYWNSEGRPAVNREKTHKAVRQYDNMNRLTSEVRYGTDGKPLTGTDTNPEIRYKYDQWGNVTEQSYYDGNGHPRLSSEGYFVMKAEYNRRGNVLLCEYFDTAGKPVNDSSNGISKVENKYDTHGNLLEARYHNTSGLQRMERYAYNDKNQLTELKIFDSKGNLTDEVYGFARAVMEYDDSGVVPKTRKYYNAGGQLLGSQTWNTDTGDWNDLVFTGATAQVATPTPTSYTPNVSNKPSNSGGGSSSGGSAAWMQEVREAARECPMTVTGGIVLQSISCTSTAVRVTIKLTEISLYELAAPDEDSIRQEGRTLKQQFRNLWNIPGNVSVTITLLDKAGRSLLTI